MDLWSTITAWKNHEVMDLWSTITSWFFPSVMVLHKSITSWFSKKSKICENAKSFFLNFHAFLVGLIFKNQTVMTSL